MVFIMNVPVTVTDRFVGMPMHVLLGQKKPNAGSHQYCGHPEQKTWDLMTERYRDHCAEKRSTRKIRACTGSPQIAQCEHEKHEANSVATQARYRSRQRS